MALVCELAPQLTYNGMIRGQSFMTSTRRGRGQAQVESCGRGRGSAPCGRPRRKLAPPVVLSCLLMQKAVCNSSLVLIEVLIGSNGFISKAIYFQPVTVLNFYSRPYVFSIHSNLHERRLEAEGINL